ncbi:MFS transporter [Frondihabitans sucicola]|uniref:MFS transporter n=1 Tax=Frondihabitans sucicola TaxID=1268041 RepID=A0ABM8GMX9_9MICO|nr:MFS transporter [Frondihabitans sucicola]BDZ49798.1 MFS transporter [Frondihabitans sucicola]
MSNAPFPVVGSTPIPAESAPAPAVKRTLLPSLAITSLVLFATYSGLISVLLPNQATAIDPAHKVQNVAIISTVSFVFTLFAQPIVGAFSDRTRSRLGRRAPWMIIGTAVAAVFLIGLGNLSSILWITVFWVVIQVALNAMQGPLTAVTPDRFEKSRRGGASAMVGLGTMAGGTIGVIVAGRLAANVGVGYTAFGIGVLVVTALFVVFNRDFSSAQQQNPPFRWRAFFSGFWIDPRKNPDFAWAFAARFLFIMGYFVVFAYQLFILTDYIGLSLGQANVQIGVISLASLATTVVSVLLAGFLSDRLGRRKVFIYIASVLMIVGLAMPLLMPTVTGMLVMSAINGFGFGLYMSCDTALMTEVLPGGGVAAGKDLGILNVATNIPQALSPAVAALLISSSFGYHALFVFGMICVALAAIALVPIKSVR